MKAELMSWMGTDYTVCDAARVSFAKRADLYTYERNARLINYLARNGHWTPFAHCMITLRMKAPLPIKVQCFRHKQGFIENEESRRYISSTPEVHVPEYFREAVKEKKQGSGRRHYRSNYWLHRYEASTRMAVSLYDQMVQDGVCPEQARFVLPQGVYVNWIWTGSLYAFASFCNQRTDSHAQQEVRDLANAVNTVVAPLYPVSWGALTK